MKRPDNDFNWYLMMAIVILMIALFMFDGDGAIVVGCPAPLH